MISHLSLRRPLKSQMKLWAGLDSRTIRRQVGLFLAEGVKVVAELLKSTWDIHALLIAEEKTTRFCAFLEGAPDGLEIYTLTGAQWGKLSQDRNSEGIMAVAAMPRPMALLDLPESGHIILAYGINNPNNLGALVRTAHWFGFEALLLSANAVDFTNPKAVRTSMGSLFHLPIIPDLDFATLLPEMKERYFLVATDTMNGLPPHPCPRNTALLLGSESHGLPESIAALADEKWHIPGMGSAESLSLPQAAAIVMYECTKGCQLT